jgi:hypothetical protein
VGIVTVIDSDIWFKVENDRTGDARGI